MYVSKKRVTTRQQLVLAIMGSTDDGGKYVLDVDVFTQ
jgi:hypothetical protein